MLITIHNLPPETRYSDVKSLIYSKCGVMDVILDSLLPDGAGKKVTVGVAGEGDAAMLVRNLNGVYIQDLQLFVQVGQRDPEDQPYHVSSSNVGNNSASNMKNNGHQAVAPSSGMSQFYQSPFAQQMFAPQMMTSQMGTPQMVPPPVNLGNYEATSSMSLNYATLQTSQLGFGIQQQYSNTNMVPTLISYPVKQNLDYGFGQGNQQNLSPAQSWGNLNASTFNTQAQNDYATHSKHSESRFDQTLPARKSKADTRINFTVDHKQGYKRKRSESPVDRQLFSRRDSRSDWSKKKQNSSGTQDSRNNDQVRSNIFNMYSSHASSSSSRDEETATFTKSRWNIPSSQSSNSNYRDHPTSDISTRSSNYDGAKKFKSEFSNRNSNFDIPKKFSNRNSNFDGAKTFKSDFSNRNSNFDGAKTFKSDFSNRKSNFDGAKNPKWNKNDKMHFPSPNRVFNDTIEQQSAADTRTVKKNMIVVPTLKKLKIGTNIRVQCARTITNGILNKQTLKKTRENIPDKLLYQTMCQAVKARLILLTNTLYDFNSEYCVKAYRQKFSEDDDQHFYNVIVNRCKHENCPQAEKELPSNVWKTKSSDAAIYTKSSTPVSTDTKKPEKKENFEGYNLPTQPEASVNADADTPLVDFKGIPDNNESFANKPKVKKTKVQIPAPIMLPKYPQGNKQVYKETKKEAKLQFQEGPSAITGDPVIKDAVEKEIGDIDKDLLQLFEESFQTADPMEKIFFDLFETHNVGRKINEALQVHILRRMLNTKVKPLLRITGNPKPPNKTTLTNFLNGHGVLNLKKSDRGSFYIATCNSFKSLDKLLDMANVVIDNKSVYFKPLHLGGPPDKKAMRNSNMSSELAKIYNKYQTAKAVTSTKPLANMNENVNDEVPANLSDDTDCKMADDIHIENHAKAKDIKCEEQEHIVKLENKDENKEIGVIKENEILTSGIKDQLGWPEETGGDDWTEDTEIKKELHANDTVDKESEKGAKSDAETVIIKTENNDDDIENDGDNENVDADDINMDDLDEDDLEDY